MQSRCSKNLSFEIGEKLVKLLKVEMRSREKTSDMVILGRDYLKNFKKFTSQVGIKILFFVK